MMMVQSSSFTADFLVDNTTVLVVAEICYCFVFQAAAVSVGLKQGKTVIVVKVRRPLNCLHRFAVLEMFSLF